MKIQLASDLHLELDENSNYIKDFPLIPCGNILILAGDIGYIGQSTYDKHPFWDWASQSYERVLVVPGNKEFYGNFDLSELKNGIKTRIRHNIHWYYNKSEVINGIEFIMTTLWSFIPVSAEYSLRKAYPDFKFIRHNAELISIDIYNKLHSQCIEFLMRELQQKIAKTVIVSHHAPSILCIPNQLKGSPMNCAFYSDMEKLIKLYNPDYWVYGHSHRNVGPLQIAKTVLLSNQLGYVDSLEQDGFDRASCFII